jgi:hypothetical protein
MESLKIHSTSQFHLPREFPTRLRTSERAMKILFSKIMKKFSHQKCNKQKNEKIEKIIQNFFINFAKDGKKKLDNKGS